MAEMIDTSAVQRDIQDIGEAVNESKVINPRYGDAFKSLPLVSQQAQAQADEVVAQGFYKGFPTETALKASLPAVSEMRARADDTRKIWRWSRTSAEGVTPVTGTWTDTGLSELDQAKTYSDLTKLDYSQIRYGYTNGNLIGNKSSRKNNFGVNNLNIVGIYNFYDSVVIPVNPKDILFIFNNTSDFLNGAYYAFYQDDPFKNPEQAEVAHRFKLTTADVAYREIKVPDTARYLIMNTRFTPQSLPPVYFSWAVHVGAFSNSYNSGIEYIVELGDIHAGIPDTTMNQARLKKSTKNLYVGDIETRRKVGTLAGTYATSSNDDTVSPFIAVEYGKTYTISGVSPAKTGTNVSIYGTENNSLTAAGFTKLLIARSLDTITLTIDDVRTKFIVFNLTQAGSGTAQDAYQMPVQVELGSIATVYEPAFYSDEMLRLKNAGSASKSVLVTTTQFVELDKARDATSTVTDVTKDIGPLGVNYSVKGGDATDHAANILYSQIMLRDFGKKSVYANVQKYIGEAKAVKSLDKTAFNIPSGSLDNPNVFSTASAFPLAAYAHPSIKYTATPIAGFKYWMVASMYIPAATLGAVLWEDEDLFVSNDAKEWQRVRSLYETDKTYTTTALRLPPQNLAKGVSRENAFLPIPPLGSTFEVSVPASGGRPAFERVQATIDVSGSWKHDPYLFLDDGYIHVYHTFNLRCSVLGADVARFFVCVRTNNGIDWDVVRNDGSTMRITEQTSRELFTKDSSGRYNYLNYQFGGSRGNPEVVKYGENDYELFYGYNFSLKYAGSTPYNFDFSTPLTVQDVGSSNHPTLLLDSGILYLLANTKVYSSTDRGASWIAYPHYPLWLGGVSGISYKKSCCIGDEGKLIVADAQLIDMPSHTKNSMYTTSAYIMSLYEYSSLAQFIDYANTGLVDAYVDILLVTTDIEWGVVRKVNYVPYVGSTSYTIGNSRTLDTIKVADIDFKATETVHAYIALNSRNGARIDFGGIYVK